MLPKWHILWGGIFTLILWAFVPEISFLYLGLVFLSSFLIDFDHYIWAVKHTRKFGLSHALKFHEKLGKKEVAEKKKGIKKRGPFHLFHTVEFHGLIGLLGFFWIGFFYVFIGMIFHSLLDLMYLVYLGRLYRREYFLFSWLRNRF
jgi:hypothetical protein